MGTEMAATSPALAQPLSRRSVLSAGVVAVVAAALGPGLAPAPAAAAVIRNRVYTISARNTFGSVTTPRTEFRALWTASVVNIDWPSKPGLPVATQQGELRSILDLALSRNLNAVLLQVRPAADRMWKATLGEPWSKYLTGTQGKDPGYDPLAYAIAQAHQRGLALHAWINPFRVSMDSSLNSLVASHPARLNPGWSFAYGGRRYYNPGIPAVRTYIRSVVVDLVKRYDVDGVHFDDYFYPYPVAGSSIPDTATYAAYQGPYTAIASWRRNNINVFVRDTYNAIKAAKRRVVFGIGPFGIWANRSSSTLGSATSGLEGFYALYADTRRWIKDGWVDYIAPQLYWYQGYSPANYNVLVDWWAKQVAGTNVKLYIGEAAYKVGDPATAAWRDPNELRDHLRKSRTVAAVRGHAYYNTTAFRANKLNAIGILKAAHYARPALPVPYPQLIATRPYTPVITKAVREDAGVRLSWTSSSAGEALKHIAIWRWESTGSVVPYIQSTATYLRTVRRRTAAAQSWLDTAVVPGHYYWYMIQSISQTGVDSSRATAIFIRA
ncbi:family 10 glycosylhydrolase [Paeniglutamicibacter gangotriensis]|uniref:Family 10 glycosylhydrolase n=1 Tax=Paeniglutamicibacter gangotriensis TaxID=254787 RepID=A0A5B0EKQ3_9MICC|nr:family 10 glycosylhydrolase [Paeniglutamicibacter gangotriensis]KAA0977919.1 family 10 glycosylhydrolase [Paeniglutamicibacter gangotriensis]